MTNLSATILLLLHFKNEVLLGVKRDENFMGKVTADSHLLHKRWDVWGITINLFTRERHGLNSWTA